MRAFPIVLISFALLLTDAGIAHADAIDGAWCRPDGKRMSIQGPDIVTPRGTKTSGDYDRHAFSYTVPAGDPEAGSTVNMVLIDDDTLHTRTNGTPGYGPGEADVWRRCRPTTS